MNFILILFLLFIGCSKINPTIKSSCSNSGNIHFMYVNVPCEECVIMIEEILDLMKNPKIENIVATGLETEEEYLEYDIDKNSAYLYLRNNTLEYLINFLE